MDPPGGERKRRTFPPIIERRNEVNAMFRRFFLRRTLSRVAVLLVAKYGRRDYFSLPQVTLVAEELRVSADIDYCLQLFTSPDSAPSLQEADELKRRRESLYRYFDRTISSSDVEANRYWRILNLGGQKVPGSHTQISTNEHITGSGSLR